MSDIDAEKLQEALAHATVAENFMTAGQKLILAAARAHLATLPRYKDVEVVRWCLVSATGHGHSFYAEEEMARGQCPHGWHVVKLTGTARVKV